jgi:hypothetical protein
MLSKLKLMHIWFIPENFVHCSVCKITRNKESAIFVGAQVPGDNLVGSIIHAIVYTSFTIRACLAELLEQLSG